MIIQHNISSMMTNRQLGISNTAAAKKTERLSSGYKINRAADDAAALSISEKLRSQIRGLDRASTNMDDAVSLINVADGAMSEIDDLLQRVNELCVQGANDTNFVDDRSSIQTEISQLLEEVKSITDKTEFNGIKVLKGGFNDQVPIFGINGALSSVLLNMANGGAADSTAMGSLSDTLLSEKPEYTATVANVTTGTPAAPVPLPIIINGKTYDTAAPNNVFSKSPSPLYGATPTTPGAGVTVIKDAVTNIEYTFSVQSSYTPGTNTHSASYIDFKNVNAANVNTLLGTGFHSTCCTCTDRYSIRFVDTASTVRREGNNYIYEVDITGLTSGQDIIQKIMQDLGGRDSYIHPQTGANIPVANPQGHYTWFGEEVDASGNPTGRLLIADERDNQRPSPSSGSGIFGEGIYGIVGYTGTAIPNLLNIQSGANTEESVKMFLPNTLLNKLGLNGTIHVNTHALATSAISKVQTAIESVNAQRSYLGAMQNRFEHGISNADNSSENLQVSESRLRDADIPEEMVQLSKYNILKEAAQSMLTQAVNNPQKIMALLQ